MFPISINYLESPTIYSGNESTEWLCGIVNGDGSYFYAVFFDDITDCP